MIHNSRAKKSKGSIGLISLVVLVIALIIGAVSLMVLFPKEDVWIDSNEININNPAQSGFVCDAIEAQKLYVFGNGLIKISRDRVSYLDLKGNELFGEVVSMESPFCKISQTRALIGDSKGFEYLVLDFEKIIYKATAKGTLDYGSINDAGYVALVMDEPGIKGVTKILKPDGTGLFSWESAESGYILSCEINPASQLVDVALVNTDGALVAPMLKRFGINGEAKGQFLPQVTQILPMLLYDADMNPVNCGSSDIVCFDGTKEKYHVNFSKIYTSQTSDYGILVIAKKQANDIPKLYLVKNDGSMTEGVPLSEEITPLAVKGSKVAVGSGNSIITISIEKMKELSRTPVSASPIRVGFSSLTSQIIVIARDGVTAFIP